MGQIAIYPDSKIEKKINNDWPESVISLASAWKDFPFAEEIRRIEGTDIKRKEL